MTEIDVFLDKELKSKVTDTINFGVVEAGKTSTRQLYIKNNINHLLEVILQLKGLDIEINKKMITVAPLGVSSVTFTITPKLTSMKPIKGKLTVNVKYIIQ